MDFSATPCPRPFIHLPLLSLVPVSALQSLTEFNDVLCLVGATYVVLNPEYAKPTHRGARTGVFIALGLCAIVPAMQLVIRHGTLKVFSEMGFGWLLSSGTSYIVGALI